MYLYSLLCLLLIFIWIKIEKRVLWFNVWSNYCVNSRPFKSFFVRSGWFLKWSYKPICTWYLYGWAPITGIFWHKIFINDLFYRDLESKICNFADDTTTYACDTNVDSVIIKLERDLHGLLEWYAANGMCANPSKFQIMFLGLKRKINYTLKSTDNWFHQVNMWNSFFSYIFIYFGRVALQHSWE